MSNLTKDWIGEDAIVVGTPEEEAKLKAIAQRINRAGGIVISEKDGRVTLAKDFTM